MVARHAPCNRLSLLVTAGLDRWSPIRQNSAYGLLATIYSMIELTYAQLKARITAHGFAAGYLLQTQSLGEAWERQYKARPPHTGNLCLDPVERYPWARAIVLLVRTYVPFEQNSILPGYYIASNAGYHAANALARDIQSIGYRAERLELPLTALVSEAGLGRLLKNALLDIGEFGTRTALFTLVTDACAAEKKIYMQPPACRTCTLCARACPAGAIDPVHGLDAARCLRTHMEGDAIPQWVAERMPGLLGCERCQAICPRNAHLGTRAPTEAEESAFNLERLICGDIADARVLVGKNMCSRGRLQMQAYALNSRLRGQYES